MLVVAVVVAVAVAVVIVVVVVVVVPVVPHKAVAEVSEEETYRRGWLL